MNADKEIRRAILNKGLAEGIILDGGLGDILERMSRLTKYGIEQETNLNIYLSNKNLRIFKGLRINPCLKMVEHEINKGVGYNIFMASIGDELPEPIKFIEEEQLPIKEKNILCCWGAAGSADKMSRWIRSIKHEDAKIFYERLDWSHVNRLIDITEWKEWERKNLNKMGIQIFSPTKGKLTDMCRIVSNSEIIITVDTMMVHLCAGMNKRVKLLLPLHGDERWAYLLDNNNTYKKNCHVIRQENYGIWKSELEYLSRLVSKGLTNL